MLALHQLDFLQASSKLMSTCTSLTWQNNLKIWKFRHYTMGLSGSSITKIFTKHNKLECDGYHYLSEMYNSTLLKQANVHNHELCNKTHGPTAICKQQRKKWVNLYLLKEIFHHWNGYFTKWTNRNKSIWPSLKLETKNFSLCPSTVQWVLIITNSLGPRKLQLTLHNSKSHKSNFP